MTGGPKGGVGRLKLDERGGPRGGGKGKRKGRGMGPREGKALGKRDGGGKRSRSDVMLAVLFATL